MLQRIEKLENEVINLEKQIKDLLAFDPDELTQNIQKAQKDLAEAKKTASENKLLEPITDHIKQIESHFKSVATVSEVNDDIYKILLNLFKKKDNLVLNRQ